MQHLGRGKTCRSSRGACVRARSATAELPRQVVHARKKGFPIPDSFTVGTERILHGGAMAEGMGWSSATTEEVVASATDYSVFRFQLVGLELWFRIFFRGERPEDLGERLQALAA